MENVFLNQLKTKVDSHEFIFLFEQWLISLGLTGTVCKKLFRYIWTDHLNNI